MRMRAGSGGRERRILLVFGIFSSLYGLALPAALMWYAAQFLMDRFGFAGLIASGLLGVLYAYQPLKKMLARQGGTMGSDAPKEFRWRKYAVPAALASCLAAALLMPWTASVGSYGTLLAIPGREAVVRAAEGASLINLNIRPGQEVMAGTEIGRMANLDVDDQIAQLRTERARAVAEASRLAGERKVAQQGILSADWQFAQRQRDFRELDHEQEQIRTRIHRVTRIDFTLASDAAPGPAPLPAALAALEANVAQVQAKREEAVWQRDRARKLFHEGILARTEMDAAETRTITLTADFAAAKQRLNAALIEHRRRHASSQTEVKVARAATEAERAQVSNLTGQWEAAAGLRNSIEERLELLERERAQFNLVAPVAGTILGEDLPRALGQYFSKGSEICRVADTRELLVRVQVAEQALGDIAAGQAVRVKTRAWPDRVFRGVVSRIGAESEVDTTGQRSYRVELTIRNTDGLLRPGMTVFARVDFGRSPVAFLMAHKLKQALRPELWML